MGEAVGAADLLLGLRRQWTTGLLIAAPLLAGVVGYAESLPAQYESRAVLVLAPRPDAGIGGDVLRAVAPKYVAFLTSRAALAEVAARSDQPLDRLLGAVDVTIPPETATLEITVTSRDPAAATRATAALSSRAVGLAARDPLLSAEVVVAPSSSDEPVGPPRRLLEAAGVLLALLVGAAAALVDDRRRPRIAGPAELSSATGVPVLAALPTTRSLQEPVTAAARDPLVAAALGSLLPRLAPGPGQEVRVLAVLGAEAGVGSTTVAGAVAGGVAALGASVLLVSADAEQGATSPARGRADAGTGTGTVERPEGQRPPTTVALPTATPNLKAVAVVVGASPGTVPTSPADQRWRRLLADATAEYDLVVVDCPAVASAGGVGRVPASCDAALLVVDRGSPAEAAGAAAAALRGRRVPVLGAVLNRAGRGVALRGGVPPAPGGPVSASRPPDS